MKTLLRSSRRLTSGPENALASRRQIRYPYTINSLLRWQVETAECFNSSVIVVVASATLRCPNPVLAGDLLIAIRIILGGLKRWSQRFQIGDCDDDTKTGFRPEHSKQDALFRSTEGSPARAAWFVVEIDQKRVSQQKGRSSGWRVCACGQSLI